MTPCNIYGSRAADVVVHRAGPFKFISQAKDVFKRLKREKGENLMLYRGDEFISNRDSRGNELG